VNTPVCTNDSTDLPTSEVAKFKELSAPQGQLFTALADEKKSDMSDRYNISKLLGMFVVRQLADMAPFTSSGVIVNCVAPGYAPYLSTLYPLLTSSQLL